ncbi:MAG: alpha/beta hydrolase [Pseudomonadales bacterium]|jgi:pimeloyl-ACP methyl ester carboxylesterase|nr:alpha/beta hydrolase [Pseudomonadales bacterium]MDP6472509.1 alpha/beta hydrolase [Pseudomonadales bacterium]MDP6828680.1 alpha/beta hydrolase [Pseudomonadales bacterium]MDP6973090.1 alpha/beta hydrolase [Pseudomonadales bacterium]|tara:strand:+ start:1169 stop:2200 length:1032 start_codon:yes stop_codon:yes gene_type:complete
MERHSFTSGAHTTAYLAAGPENGPLIIFVHGWPELGLSWRHQLAAFGALGFRCVAPDLRGYGGSTCYDRHADYAQEQVVGDMLSLLDHLGRERAVWVGHDWGSPTVWSIARDHAGQCEAVASLCVPYYTIERGLDAILPLVNRDIYPEATFPAGQWEYMRFYEEHFVKATHAFDSNPYNVAKLLFRKGSPEGFDLPSATAHTRHLGGWFPDGSVPDVPRDADVITEDELAEYAQALKRNTFFGPDSYYMNHEINAEYAANAVDNVLHMPVLFIAAQYDYTCECITSRLADPMRERCKNLSEAVIASGHWMAQERPWEVSAELARWLAQSVAHFWPEPEPPQAP